MVTHRLYGVYSASNQYSVLHASLALESYRGSKVFDLDDFYSVQVVKQIRITHKSLRESPGEPCWVRLKQCWVILFEVEIKINLLFPGLSY